MIHKLIVIIMLLVLLPIQPLSAYPNIIIPGKGIGTNYLGEDVGELRKRLGNPNDISVNSSIIHIIYLKQLLQFGIAANREVVLIATTSKVYKDIFNIGVNTMWDTAKKKYGLIYTKIKVQGMDAYIYGQYGITFIVENGIIVMIGVFTPVAQTQPI